MKPSILFLLSIVFCASLLKGGDRHAEDDAFWAAAAALLPGFDGEPREVGSSDLNGSWGPVVSWPHVPVSAAALPDGKLLTFSGQERRTWPGTKHQTYWVIYDPKTGEFSDDSLYLDHEMFCAHLVMRADGVLQTNGGRYTIEHSSIFDWKTREWQKVDDMNDRRWYTTSVALADGDVFTVSGSGGANTAERFDTESNSWNRVSGIDWQPVANAEGFESNWWPYLFVSPEGKLFHFGPTEEMHWVDPNGSGSRVSAGLTVPGDYYPKHAGVAMYESGKILVAGGAANPSGGSSNLCYTVDLNTTPPTVKAVAPMTHPRRFSSAVMLPSGEVMIIGGNTSGRKFSDQGTVLTPEIWDPKTGLWREVADMVTPRNYHSVGLLLADGTVFAGGGGYGTSDLGNTNHQDGEVFTPANLFTSEGVLATRPEIDSLPESTLLGSVFDVSGTPSIQKFSAIRLVATTHGWSTDLRYLSLPFSEVSPGEYQVIGHPNPHVMVPGFWMIFALDEYGVHSESKIVHVLPNPKDSIPAEAKGLKAEYFNGKLLEKKFEQVDSTVNFRWGSGSPDSAQLGNDNYSARWTGWIVPETSGIHTFYTNSDDGVRLWVDGTLLVDNWTDHPPTEDQGAIELVDGDPVALKVEWYEKGGGAVMELRWEAPGVSKQIVPAGNFLRSLELDQEGGTDATYLSVDDRHELFVDGDLVGIGTDWREIYRRELSLGPRATLAIKSINTGGPGSIVGDFLVGGKRYVTDSTWKVSGTFEEGWHEPDFDDSSWVAATDHGGPLAIHSAMPQDTQARNIWGSDLLTPILYVRKSVGALALSNIAEQRSVAGEETTLQLDVQNVVGALSFEVEGLPVSLELDRGTGIISGVPLLSEVGLYNVVVIASDQEQSIVRSFDWLVVEQGDLDEEFDSGTGGFLYRDDLFRGTSQPGSAAGEWTSSEGNSGGGLEVLLGGEEDVSNMSGGFEKSFELAGERLVQISFDYYLSADSEYEAGEFSQVLFALDGILVGKAFPNDYIEQLDEKSNLEAGWKTFVAELGPLAPGEHTLAIGAFSSRKTTSNRGVLARFDNLKTVVSPLPNEAPIIDAIDGQENSVGDSVSYLLTYVDPEGDSVLFQASGLPTGLSMEATTGIISGSLETEGSFLVSVIASDGNQESGASFTWTVNPVLEIGSFVSVPKSSGSRIEFAMSMTGGTQPQYKWNFGDGTLDTSYSSSPVAEHVYENPGRYLVTFTALDQNGDTFVRQFYQNVRAELSVIGASNSQTIAFDEVEGGVDRVWMVNPDNDSVSVFTADSLGKIVEVPVGRKPRSLAVLPNGHVWVVNKSSDEITEIDGAFVVTRSIPLPFASQPHGLVVDASKQLAYVSLEATGEILKIRLSDGFVEGTVSLGMHVRGLALDASGDTLFVSRFVTPPVPGESGLNPETEGVGGEVIRISTTSMSNEETIVLRDSVEPDSGGGARGIPNYLGAIAISPTGKEAWVPSKQDNIHRGLLRDGRELNHDNTVRAITSRIDLETSLEDYSSRIDHDDAAIPSSAVFGPGGLYVFVALEGSREVAVIDNFGRQELFRFPVQRAPQGLAISPDGGTLFVQNFLSRSLSAHDISSLVEQGVAEQSALGTVNSVEFEALAQEVLRGKKLFYDAFDDRLSRADYMSCASCHNDGGHDGRVWDLSGFGEGVRNTIDLRGRSGDGHGALHWSANFDEVQDFEGQIRTLSEGTGLIVDGEPHAPLGLPNTGRSEDLDALAAYLFSLDAFDPSPHRQDDGSLSGEAEAGRSVFVEHNCAACHSGGAFSDSDIGGFHEVGTLKVASGMRLGAPLTGLDTPTLKDVWATAPYLHDGSALSLEAAVRAHETISLSDDEVVSVVRYLKELGGDALIAPSPQLPRIQNFSADRTSIANGESVTLSWSVEDGGTSLESVFIDGGVGSVGSVGSITVTPGVSRSYEIIVKNQIGEVSATVTITVAPPLPVAPRIEIFESSSPNIVQGESILLSWFVEDSGSPLNLLEIDQGIGDVLNASSVELSPAVSTTYELTAVNAGGSVSAQATVVVNIPQPVAPVISTFSASAQTIEAGEKVTLTWATDDSGYAITSLSIDQGVGDVLGVTSVELSPAETTTYKLAAVNAGGSVFALVTVTVEEPQTEVQTPYGPTPLVMPSVVQAEDFDNGGEGVAYSDRDSGNNGGVYRQEDPDLENSGDNDGTPSLGWFGEGEWTEYSITAVPGTYILKARVASAYSGVSGLNISIGGRQLESFVVENTGGWQEWVTLVSSEITITESGLQIVRIEATGDGANVNWIKFDLPGAEEPEPAKQTPYGSSPLLMPGVIQAEDFDIGGEGVAYSDIDTNNNGGVYRNEGPDIESSYDIDDSPSIGWFYDGEWIEYTVDTTPGVYDLKVRVATDLRDSGLLSITLGERLLGSFVVDYTGGWTNWVTLTLEGVELTEEGLQVLRVESSSSDVCLNWIEFALPGAVDPEPVQTPYGSSPLLMPGLIQAEDFDIGGEGVAYSDIDPNNNGGVYRNEGPDIENSYDIYESPSVGWFYGGEWTEYTVDVTPGIYDLKVRVATGLSEAGLLSITLGERSLGSFGVDYTGGWNNWVTLTLEGVELTEEGLHVLRVESSGTDLSLNWIEFALPSEDEPEPLQTPYGSQPLAMPGVIQAEDFDIGGEGVAYSDIDLNNNGGAYRNEGPDIEHSYDIDESPSIGWFYGGEWTEYTVDVTPGVYDLKVRVATDSSDSGLLAFSLGERLLGSIVVDYTGGWTNWVTLTLEGVELTEEGLQVLRVKSSGTDVSLNWIEFLAK